MTTGKISKIAGPLVVATGMREANMFDVVRVSDSKLIGEIIEMHGDRASIQVYEETSGLGTGEPVESTGEPLSVELGPGLIEGIFDGIQRPLEKIRELVGNSLVRGVEVPALDREKKWHFVPKVKAGDKVVGGDILGTVQETEIVEHRIMVKPGIVAVCIYTFLNAWDDYMMSLIIMQDASMKTLPVGIAETFLGEYCYNYGGMMAFAVIGSLPIVLLFIFLQKHMIAGLTAGAVKG